jgi:signal transduction histidine kinase
LGIGFEPGDAERIFSVFEQGSRDVTARYGGLGLGLAIAQASVRAHGGRIGARSAGPGACATFTVELPLAPPA